MKCDDCGALNSEKNSFCNQCGASLADVKRRTERERLLELSGMSRVGITSDTKSYPALSIISVIAGFIGWSALLAGMIIASSQISQAFIYFEKEVNKGTWRSYLADHSLIYMLLALLLFGGLLSIVQSEVIRVLIDHRHNADRQTIALEKILAVLSEKGST